MNTNFTEKKKTQLAVDDQTMPFVGVGRNT